MRTSIIAVTFITALASSAVAQQPRRRRTLS